MLMEFEHWVLMSLEPSAQLVQRFDVSTHVRQFSEQGTQTSPVDETAAVEKKPSTHTLHSMLPELSS
jgi:hypothetical protein